MPAAQTSESEAPVAEPALGFETWAELAVGMMGKDREEKLAALSARGLRPEDWARIDEHHFGVLSADVLAGRTDRQVLYEAKCTEEMARRSEGAASRTRPASPSGASSIFANLGVVPPAASVASALSPPLVGAVVAPAVPVGLSTAVAPYWTAEEREAMGKLPFVAAPEAGAEPGKGPLKTMPVRMMPSPSGGTFGLYDGGSFQKMVAAVPFAGAAADSSSIYFPELTVQQYVSLHFELARPGANTRAEALARYRVPNEASMGALDQHWKERIAASPELPSLPTSLRHRPPRSLLSRATDEMVHDDDGQTAPGGPAHGGPPQGEAS